MDFVTQQIAQKLKEKGFKEKVYGYYHKEHLFQIHPERDMNDSDKRCSAPTISQVLKWLREEKKIYIGISYMPKIPNETGVLNDFYYPTFQKIDLFEPMFSLGGDDAHDNYEEAALAGIDFVLDNLI